ncbi:hypothetical protein BREU_2345 [Bifidobacterium reuteri DSM 23975]|uniref:Uncharacterized protein n=1 Tax=Bifidobacterium reuteri DSM 23975 TaxID=1437610 RepID=A0A087CEI1_9BIFI|nr:hypothetical protein [Bifidobacterium reuteri]KFI81681.1 hypothetical protein BREU_2345 [Bifidobacterium reuteri DSM 23975]
MSRTASQTHIDDLICAERGTGVVSWHGMNMLVISYETTDTDAEAGPTLRRLQTAASGDTNPTPSETAPPPPTDLESGPVSRDMVLDALHRLSADKIGRRRRTGGGQHESRLP